MIHVVFLLKRPGWEGQVLTVGLGMGKEFPAESRPVFVSHIFSAKKIYSSLVY